MISVAGLHLRLERRSSAPLHAQIFEGLRAAVLGQRLRPGARVPSSRTLACDLGVARTTVLQALDGLVAEGYLVAAPRSGVRVAPELPVDPRWERPRRRPARPLRLSLSGRSLLEGPTGAPHLGAAPRAFRPGVPALDAFPVAAWARTLARCQARASAALLEGDASGVPALRKAIARHVRAARGVEGGGEQVFITAGTRSAIEDVLRLVLDAGDAVWVEDPSYLGGRRAVIAAGGRPVPVPVDGDGLDVATGIARAPEARAVLLAPSHQYPLGVTLSLGRRMALLAWAARAGALLLEDDYDSEFRHRGRPLTALQGLDADGRVAYIGTFSKSLFPGLRLGFVVVPEGLVEPMARSRRLLGPPASSLEQAAVARFIDEGHFARHLRRMRQLYRERGEALVEALRRTCAGALEVPVAETGMQLCARLSDDLLDTRVRDAAAARGVEVAALSDYALEGPAANGLVFGFGAVRPRAIREGAVALARALREVRRRVPR